MIDVVVSDANNCVNDTSNYKERKTNRNILDIQFNATPLTFKEILAQVKKSYIKLKMVHKYKVY